jgi:hypothetical protein
LSVLIDELEALYGVNEPLQVPQNCWPLIIPSQAFTDSTYDRWDIFNRYVRPVIDDLNPLVFMTVFWWRRFPVIGRLSGLDELELLAKLCQKIEIATALLDAALENPVQARSTKRVTPLGHERMLIVPTADADTTRVEEISRAIHELHIAWNRWVALTRVTHTRRSSWRGLRDTEPLLKRVREEYAAFRRRLRQPGK